MPELPEVEVLARHLAPLLKGRIVRGVAVCRRCVIEPASENEFVASLEGAQFISLNRRGKYLLFTLQRPRDRNPFVLLGHLGMTGRMYLQPRAAPPAKHAAVVFDLGREQFVFEDTRYFGRFTFDLRPLDRLGPEPLSAAFSASYFAAQLRRSRQPIKVKLLDQSLLAGIGNLYASEILFRARLPPQTPARRLTTGEIHRLRRVIREVLAEAIAFGSTVPLDFGGTGSHDGLFYYGRKAESETGGYAERLCVYDREGEACFECGAAIRRIVQAARSTFFCPRCQRR